MAVDYLGDNNPDGVVMGLSASEKIAFYNATPVVQPSGSGGTTLTLTYTASNGFGFTTSAQMESVKAQLAYIVSSLKALGLSAGE
jgi:hypothetical protein|tara:strand:- start:992 stop:1246 length:255 start_codon:yes stop_codon:yes gene_type:complete